MLKKFIFSIFIFLLPVIAILACAEIVLRKIPNDYSYKRNILLKNAQDIEILIIGGSQTLYGINPDYLSMNGFNLANVSESFDFSYKLLKKYGKRLDNIKLVIIPVTYISLYFRLDKADDPWRMKNYSLYYHVSVPYKLSHFSELLNGTMFLNISRLQKALYRDFQPDDFITVTKSGFQVLPKQDTEIDFIQSGKTRSEFHNTLAESGQYAEYNKKMLDNIINYCKINSLPLLIVTTPAYYTYRENIDNILFDKDMHYISDLVDGYDFVYYRNYFDDASFIQTDFWDADHLNASGAKKLTKKIDVDIGKLLK